MPPPCPLSPPLVPPPLLAFPPLQRPGDGGNLAQQRPRATAVAATVIRRLGGWRGGGESAAWWRRLSLLLDGSLLRDGSGCFRLLHRDALPGGHQLRGGGADGHQDGAAGPLQRPRQLEHQLCRSLQLEDGHVLRRRLRLRARTTQPKLVWQIIARHREPHRAAICAIAEQCNFWSYSWYHREAGDAIDA